MVIYFLYKLYSCTEVYHFAIPSFIQFDLCDCMNTTYKKPVIWIKENTQLLIDIWSKSQESDKTNICRREIQYW